MKLLEYGQRRKVLHTTAKLEDEPLKSLEADQRRKVSHYRRRKVETLKFLEPGQR